MLRGIGELAKGMDRYARYSVNRFIRLASNAQLLISVFPPPKDLV